jgi:hypothetical protein
MPQSMSSAIQLLDDEERRGFLYFRARTVRKMFGQLDAVNWVPELLQLGHVEPAIKHAIVALASLHESIEPANPFTCESRPQKYVENASYMLALKHYNKAIESLTIKPFDMTSRPDSVLTLCILFICFEQFRTEDAACITHLLAGLKLVNWWRSLTNNYNKLRSYPKPTVDLVNFKIIPSLQRIRVQFALCMDLRHELRNADDLPYFPPPTIPSSYQSLDVARTDFDRVMNYAFSTLHDPSSLGPVQDVNSILKSWKHALDASGSTESASVLQNHACKLLNLYYHVSVIIAATYKTETEELFDDWNERFQLIIDLADELIQYWRVSTQEYSLLFNFDLGITPPMFFVASRCRNPQIRRKAADLMLHSPFYRGVWRDRYTGLCAQRIIELEELGLEITDDGFCLPEHGRVRKVCADLDKENNRIILQYMYSPFTSDSPICTTLITLS